MSIDWFWGLLGGLMIGGAAVLMLLLNARIMGASGILAGLMQPAGAVFRERAVFTLGLVGAPALVAFLWHAPEAHVTPNWLLLIIAGLLVGFGARLGNGCTSGHGVCGMSRFSRRSIIATMVYVGFGMVAVAIARHVLGVI
ncbi:YeeE/YedE thiosulfate transporter family protein [Thioclava sp. 'Guangxiensis']|uniref:YeeE/YedE family protein n=1 Tax=Thioclava sp. 'Guangxiensis' TaxID=3149044 RepID=UPI003877FAE5